MKVTLVLVFSALLAGDLPAIRAQGTTAFVYQGRLAESGSSVSGNYGLAFTLFATPTFGNPVSGPITNQVAVAGGLFATSLDFGVGVFDGAARWLEITVLGTNSETVTVLLPRQPLAPAPYSFFAATAGTVTNGAITSAQLAGSAVASVHLQDGAVTGGKIPGGQVVKSLNGLRDHVSLAAGSGLGLTTNESVLQITAQPFPDTAWSRTGNFGTTPGANFLGTVDNQSLDVRVNNARVLRLEPNPTSPNLVGGWTSNSTDAGVSGATISGGGAAIQFSMSASNRVTDHFGTIGGGAHNLAGNTSGNFTDAYYATVGGGHQNAAKSVSSTVGGGANNEASAGNTTVAGGYLNAATGPEGTVGGGYNNRASGGSAVVAGGSGNTASGATAFVGGGSLNHADGGSSTVAGGYDNFASGGLLGAATVGGGSGNEAHGAYATVPGGYLNVAQGWYSFAAGVGAKALHDGSFVWSDASGGVDMTSVMPNEFVARASGGFEFFTSANLSTGVRIFPGGNAWSPTSDRNVKENFKPIDVRSVLAKVSQMPITEWNLKTQDPSIRHFGPMAQDFRAAFGLGNDDRHISTSDADGVALAAIQGLHQLVQEQRTDLDKKKARIAELDKQTAKTDLLEERVKRLERLLEESLSGIGGAPLKAW